MKIKKVAVIIACIVVFTAVLTVFPFPVNIVKAAEQMTIVNHQGYLDSTGYYNVYGEVKNTGDTPAKNVYVKITFMSPAGADEDEHDVLIHTILPGRKAPFAGTAGAQGSTVTSYTVELMDLTMSGEDMPKVLDIVSSSSELNVINNMMINGKVKNNGAETSTYTRVYATVYDGPSGTGNVVAVTSCTAQPYNIEPGQTGDFQMGFFITQSKSYASMVIVAESDQYAATTEYAVAMSQTSTTAPSPTSQTSSPAASSSTEISPSPTVPEFPSLVFVPLLVVGMLIAATVIKRK